MSGCIYSCLVALLVWGSIVISSCSQTGGEPPGSREGLEIAEDGTARAIGTLLRNERLCEVDAICRLILRAGSVTVTVVYVEAEGDPCPNRTAADAGYAAQPGDRLEVFGACTAGVAQGSATIFTCARDEFYIRPAPSNKD